MKIVVVIFSILMSLATVAQAQFSKIHVGLAFPDEMWEDRDKKIKIPGEGKGGGFTAMGYNIGYKRCWQSPYFNGVAAVLGVDVFYNELNKDYKKYTEGQKWENVIYPKHINVPVSFGFFMHNFDSDKKLYIEAAMGINFSMITKYSFAGKSGYQDMVYKYKPSVGVTVDMEAGVLFSKKVSIGLKMNYLNNRHKYKIQYEQAKNKNDSFPLVILRMSLCMGICF